MRSPCEAHARSEPGAAVPSLAARRVCLSRMAALSALAALAAVAPAAHALSIAATSPDPDALNAQQSGAFRRT
ncbi:MAG: FIG00638487: hypothetical protein [uncultured Paraburkholderia sp.]|nr:MAG: FIG00638487: hypothetical protein [uncultured Paraburkholderia sp.]CAH2933048.1 MAG: FIG00638487: hypothetical protein [uncultured Paraburkholderia sp.]